jgi:hypothetical protein
VVCPAGFVYAQATQGNFSCKPLNAPFAKGFDEIYTSCGISSSTLKNHHPSLKQNRPDGLHILGGLNYQTTKQPCCINYTPGFVSG